MNSCSSEKVNTKKCTYVVELLRSSSPHTPRHRGTGAVGTVEEGAGLVDNKAFLLEVLLNHFADRDSQIQQVRIDTPRVSMIRNVEAVFGQWEYCTLCTV